MRGNFDHSENCYLVGEMNLLWGGDKNLVGWNFFWWGGRMSKFSAIGGGLPPHSPPAGKTLHTFKYQKGDSEFSSYKIELQNRVTQNDVTLRVAYSEVLTETLLSSY